MSSAQSEERILIKKDFFEKLVNRSAFYSVIEGIYEEMPDNSVARTIRLLRYLDGQFEKGGEK